MNKIKVKSYFKWLFLSRRWLLVYSRTRQMFSPAQTLHPPTITWNHCCVQTLGLNVYWTFVTNTITNTARVQEQKRSLRVCVFELRVGPCLCVSACTVPSEVRASPCGGRRSNKDQDVILFLCGCHFRAPSWWPGDLTVYMCVFRDGPVKLVGLNFSNSSVSERLRQAELNWS